MPSIFDTGTQYVVNLTFSKPVNIKVSGLTYTCERNAIVKILVNGTVKQSGTSRAVNTTYTNVTSFAVANVKSSQNYSATTVTAFTIEVV